MASGSRQTPPNIVVYVMDDVDLERIPRFTRTDASTATQLADLQAHEQCASGLFNCTYDARHLDGIGERGVTFLGAHVPSSVCTPSRYSLLTGRLPSSSPFYSATRNGRIGQAGAVDVSWNAYLESSFAGLPCPSPAARDCTRRASTLGHMLQQAGYYTGFVGKFHLMPPTDELNSYAHGEHGALDPATQPTASAAAANEALQAGLRSARLPLHESVTRAGFNFTGALELGNVVDTQGIGLGVHNAEWEAEAAVKFLDAAAERLAAGAAPAFYLHMCTTLTHSPGPVGGICADSRLSAGGLLPRPPSGMMAPRSAVFARAGGRRCGWAEFDSVHTIWMDEQVGAILAKLRAMGEEEHTLLIALSDHQRLGKGALFHGVRTPMLMQWPARVAAGQVLPAELLVSSLDILPTVLDAAGMLMQSGNAMPRNAGGQLDGRSLLPLLTPAGGGRAAGGSAAGAGAGGVLGAGGALGAGGGLGASSVLDAWHESIWLELGFGGSVKHASGWQLVANVLPPEAVLPSPQADGSTRPQAVAEAVQEEWSRLLLPNGGFTHTIDTRWRGGGGPIALTIFGDARSRFDNAGQYPHYHDAEALVHAPADPSMRASFRRECPRQLACMQLLLRRHALVRTHFDGDAIPFGIYTAPEAEWSRFNSGECDVRTLRLPPGSCNSREGGSTPAAHATPPFPHPPPPSPSRPEPPAPPPAGPAIACTAHHDNCWRSRCCSQLGDACYTHRPGVQYAQCNDRCVPGADIECARLQPLVAPRPIWASPPPAHHPNPVVGWGSSPTDAVTRAPVGPSGGEPSSTPSASPPGSTPIAELTRAHQLDSLSSLAVGRAAAGGILIAAVACFACLACGSRSKRRGQREPRVKRYAQMEGPGVGASVAAECSTGATAAAEPAARAPVGRRAAPESAL
jgi:arylsulfatase A-like enzyme